MTGLVDLMPYRKRVSISNGGAVEVTGISARGIAVLFDRFPDLRKMFANREIKAEDLMKMGPDIINAVIAYGTSPGATAEELAKAEQIADVLGLGDQFELLSEIIAATFPLGLAPFLTRLERLGLIGRASAATGKGLDTKLPSQFSGSFNSGGTPQETPGATAPESLKPGTA